jgi:glycosyltransferase involved in cell wall biosynthesis
VKKVTVIIPVYNAEKFLRDSVNSILNQSYKNIEIIIVNDGSTDNSYNILISEFSILPNIIIINSINKGQSAACNLGFKFSTGEYIKFFDADDILNDCFIEEQIKLLENCDSCLASSKWGRFYNDDLSTFRLNPEKVWRNLSPIDWLICSFEQGSNMMQCAIWLIPRNILSKSGLWNEDLTLNNDFEFFVRVLLSSKKIIFSSNSILYYRSGNKSSLSQILNKKAYESGVKSNLLGCDYILKSYNNEKVKEACVENLKPWMFSTYLKYNYLSKQIELKINELSQKRIYYKGSFFAEFLSKYFGWKFVSFISFLKNYIF